MFDMIQTLFDSKSICSIRISRNIYQTLISRGLEVSWVADLPVMIMMMSEMMSMMTEMKIVMTMMVTVTKILL